jgi:DNA primase large subunit
MGFRISDFPFTEPAVEQVRSLGISLDDLLDKRGFSAVRKRAVERVIESIIKERPSEPVNPDVELLSYPLARAIVSSMKDELLLRRFALAESKLAASRLESSRDAILPISAELGMSPVRDGDGYKVHFSEYITAAAKMRSPKWKLVNKSLNLGYLTVSSDEMIRLMEEQIRDRIKRGLPLSLEPHQEEKLQALAKSIAEELSIQKEREKVDLGDVKEGSFPPCMKAMLSQVSVGGNLAHTARFALTSFLLQINMSVDQIVGLFNTSPDFDIERTRYQVQHIAGASGTRYKPPSCKTMATYGNCPGEDDLCRRIRHPLSYYERKARFEGKKGASSGNESKENDASGKHPSE